MARPRKPPSELRKRWDIFHATDDERAEIVAAAGAAGRSVSRYLIAAHRSATLPHAHEGARLVQALKRAEESLGVVARSLSNSAAPVDAVMLQADLLAIERDFRRAVLPWAIPIDAQEDASS